MQYIVRAILGLLVCIAFQFYRQTVKKVFGSNVSSWLILITASQFHFVFYMSRPLPNTFALISA